MNESTGISGRRFEVGAAFALGALLPLLETVRRGPGHWAVETTTMLEDYLAGALLLVAGGLAVRGSRIADPFLLAVWSGVTAMMTLSFVSQVEETLRGVDLEPRNGTVLCAKSVLLAVCVVALVRSFRSVAGDRTTREVAG